MKICEGLGEEPDPEEMPLEIDDLHSDHQLCHYIYNMLPSITSGMGVYAGKDVSPLESILRIKEIPRNWWSGILDIVMFIDSLVVSEVNKKVDQHRKEQEGNHGKSRHKAG